MKSLSCVNVKAFTYGQLQLRPPTFSSRLTAFIYVNDARRFDPPGLKGSPPTSQKCVAAWSGVEVAPRNHTSKWTKRAFSDGNDAEAVSNVPVGSSVYGMTNANKFRCGLPSSSNPQRVRKDAFTCRNEAKAKTPILTSSPRLLFSSACREVRRDLPTVGGPKPVNDGIRPSEDESSTAIGLIDYQRTELERYRYAVHKMGQDIVTLRQQMIELESNNSDLRRQNANYTDTTRLLQDAHELDGMPLPELAARYATLKQKFMQQTNQLRQYKQRVLELQNELIKKNDSMAGLLKMADAHEAQNTLMQRLQKKAVKLRAVEDVCKKQEKVIEKLEKLNTRGVETSDNKINEALTEENVRLRGHVDYLQDQVRASQKVDTKEDEQLLKLYEQLDKANARTTSLEKQASRTEYTT
ncbi:hypothetical protein LSAT2_011620 [Lamellibrachia satsuma]|nr:hypothetical protein LSAT2_011620 [Lamellibrachia satsuma]